MHLPRIAFLGVFPLVAGVAVACSSTPDNPGAATGTTGSGGAGGEGTTATSAASTSASTTAAATTSASSSASSGTGGGDNGMPSNVYPAPHAAAPQVVTFGGPVVTAPLIVPVFFSNDDPAIKTLIKDFVSKVGTTQYWAANTAEYGVGPATAIPPLELAEAAPAALDDPGIQTWLAGKLNGDDPAWPKPDANTLITLHYPEATIITLQGSQSCTTFGGYHSNLTLDAAHGNLNVAYAVVPRCPNFSGMSVLDATTSSESHELIEAVTDPYPMTIPAYAEVDAKHLYWQRILGGSETGDMCAQFNDSFTTAFAELSPYMVQRAWSNKSAKDGHDPCVPGLPGEVYFNSAPLLNDSITASIQGQLVTMKGVKIGVGESKAVEIDLFSEAATSGPWTVTAKDASAVLGGTSHLTFAFDKDSGVNGEKLHLTITVNTAGKNKTETFILDSMLGQQRTVWIGLVGN